MSASPPTDDWEAIRPRAAEDGSAGGELCSEDGEIRVDVRRRRTERYADWLFITVRQPTGIWTMLCMDPVGTIHGQAFGTTRKEASQQLVESLDTRGIAAFRARAVWPQEVERALASHPDVRDVVVIAGPDDRAVQAPKAVVVLESGAVVDEQELIDYAGERVGKVKNVTAIEFASTLPHSARGKVYRRPSRERLATRGAETGGQT